MSPQINDYGEIRQIIMDAIEPLKDKLQEIAVSLKNEYARKDVIDPQIKELQEDIAKLKAAPARWFALFCSAVALFATILGIYAHFHP